MEYLRMNCLEDKCNHFLLLVPIESIVCMLHTEEEEKKSPNDVDVVIVVLVVVRARRELYTLTERWNRKKADRMQFDNNDDWGDKEQERKSI